MFFVPFAVIVVCYVRILLYVTETIRLTTESTYSQAAASSNENIYMGELTNQTIKNDVATRLIGGSFLRTILYTTVDVCVSLSTRNV